MNDDKRNPGPPEHGGGDHGQKVFHIFVNTRPRIHKEAEISFDEVVELAKLALPDNHKYYVTYADGPSANPEGELQTGQHVTIRDGMTFDVSTTYQS